MERRLQTLKNLAKQVRIPAERALEVVNITKDILEEDLPLLFEKGLASGDLKRFHEGFDFHMMVLLRITKSELKSKDGLDLDAEWIAKEAFCSECEVLEYYLLTRLGLFKQKVCESAVTEEEEEEGSFAVKQIKLVVNSYWGIGDRFSAYFGVSQKVLELCYAVGRSLKVEHFQMKKAIAIYSSGLDFVLSLEKKFTLSDVFGPDTVNIALKIIVEYVSCLMEINQIYLSYTQEDDGREMESNWMTCHLIIKKGLLILLKQPVVDDLQIFLNPERKGDLVKDSYYLELSQNYLKFLLCIGRFTFHSAKFMSSLFVFKTLITLIHSMSKSLKWILQTPKVQSFAESMGISNVVEKVKDFRTTMNTEYLGFAHLYLGQLSFVDEKFDDALFYFEQSRVDFFTGWNKSKGKKERNFALNNILAFYWEVTQSVKLYGLCTSVAKINGFAWKLTEKILPLVPKGRLPILLPLYKQSKIIKPSLKGVLKNLAFHFLRNESVYRTMGMCLQEFLLESLSKREVVEMYSAFKLHQSNSNKKVSLSDIARSVSECDISWVLNSSDFSSKPIEKDYIQAFQSVVLDGCERCGDNEGKLMICGGCRAVQYCSRHCQRAHWREHKKKCQKKEKKVKK